MKVTKLLNNERAGGFTYHVKLTHADLTETAANTAQVIELITVKQGSIVSQVGFNLTTPFEDASDANLNSTTITIGDAGSAARFSASKELNVNGSEVLAWADAYGTSTMPYVYLAADTIDATIGSMAAKSLSNIDTGEIDILFNVVDISDYA